MLWGREMSSILRALLHVSYANPPIQYALACAPRLLQGLRNICFLVVPPWGLRDDSDSVAQELQLCSLLLLSQLVLSDASVCQRVCLLPGLLDFCVEGMESRNTLKSAIFANAALLMNNLAGNGGVEAGLVLAKHVHLRQVLLELLRSRQSYRVQRAVNILFHLARGRQSARILRRLCPELIAALQELLAVSPVLFASPGDGERVEGQLRLVSMTLFHLLPPLSPSFSVHFRAGNTGEAVWMSGTGEKEMAMLGNMEPMMLANRMILANIEPQVQAMVKYLRLAWEQRQARGIFRAQLAQPPNLPHAVATSYRPLDILSTVNQMTMRIMACSAHYQANLRRVVAEQGLVELLEEMVESWTPQAHKWVFSAAAGWHLVHDHHGLDRSHASQVLDLTCIVLKRLLVSPASPCMLHSSLLNGLKHVLSFNGMRSLGHSAAQLLYKLKDKQHMRQKAEKARRLLDDMRCVLDAYPWSLEQKSIFLGQMLSDDPPAGLEAGAAGRHSVPHRCREGGRSTWMDMTEAWPHTRKQLVERFWRRAGMRGALPLYRAWAASHIHRHVLSQYLRFKNRTGNLRRRIWSAWERLVAVCRSIKKVLRSHLLLHQRVTCQGAIRFWRHAVLFMRAGARQQRTAVLHSAFHQCLFYVHMEDERRELLLGAALRLRPQKKKHLGAWVHSHQMRLRLLHAMHAIATRLREGLMRKELRAWRQAVQHGKLLSHYLALFVSKSVNRKLIHAVCTWSNTTGKQQRLRALMRCKVLNSMLLALTPWAQHACSEARIRRRMERIVKRLGNRLLVQAFQRWKETRLSHHRERALRLVFSHHMKSDGHLMGLQVWHPGVQELKVMGNKATTVIRRFKTRVLAETFAWLLERVGKKVRQRKHIRLLLERISIQFFLKVWVAWRHKVLERAHKTRSLGLCVARLSRKSICQSLALWNDEKRLQQVAQKVVLRRITLALVQCVERWRDQAAHEKLIKTKVLKVDQWLMHRQLVKCLGCWRGRAVAQKVMAVAARKIMSQLCHRGQALVWEALRRFSHRQRYMRPIVSDMANRFLLRLALTSLAQWKELRLQRHRAGALHSVVVAIRQRALVVAFDKWQQRLQRQKATEWQGEHWRQRHACRLRSWALEAWHAKARQLCAYKLKAQKVLKRCKRANLCMSLLSWGHYALHQGSFRSCCSRILLQRTQRFLLDIFFVWSSYTREKQRRIYKLSQVKDPRGSLARLLRVTLTDRVLFICD